MDAILLIGGGGHCRSVIDVIEQEKKFIIAGIIDKKELIGTKIFGYEIIGCDEDLKRLREQYKYAFITIGQIKTVQIRKEIFLKLKELEFVLPSVISPIAYVSKYAFIGEGTVVMHHAVVNANVSIGKNCIINTKALIEHDSIVEDHCHISTSAVVNGGVNVKSGSFMGSNSTAIHSIKVKGFIKAGEIVK